MNPQLNKKVKKYLDSYFRDTKANSPEHQEAVMLILKGALTDANFHSEAKQLGKYFPKASKKYIGTPMEGVIEDKGVDIAKAAKYDGHDIIDAFAFYLSMSIGGSFGNRLMSLKESIEESLVEEGEQLDEKNVPTNPSKWSYYKAQAKKKFDVYPSAYANGWAAKQYKKAGGGWKSESVVSEELRPDEVESIVKKLGDSMPNHTNYDFDKGPTDAQVLKALKKYHSDFFRHSTTKQKKEIVKGIQKYTTESIEEAMITPKNGHAYYKLSKDTPIKYVSGHSGIGLKVPGVLLHNEYDTIKGKKGAYIINYFNTHFYVDIKNKFASRIAHPDNREQNKDLKKNMQFSAVAPEHSDWKKYMNESVNEVDASDIEIGDFIHLKSKNKTGMVLKISGNKVTINTPKGKITGDLKDVQLLHQDNVNEAATRTAMEIGGLTGMNKDAIQKFVDDNKLDIEKVYQFVKKGKLADRMKLVSAIAGKPNNPVQKKMVKQFGEGLIKEAKVRLGKDSVNFKVMGDRNGLTLIAASGNDLDGLQDAIANDVDVKGELRKTLEKQLKVPVDIDHGYDGAGFRFNIDFYSLAKKVK